MNTTTQNQTNRINQALERLANANFRDWPNDARNWVSEQSPKGINFCWVWEKAPEMAANLAGYSLETEDERDNAAHEAADGACNIYCHRQHQWLSDNTELFFEALEEYGEPITDAASFYATITRAQYSALLPIAEALIDWALDKAAEEQDQ